MSYGHGCSDCRHWNGAITREPNGDITAGSGQCRINPPQPDAEGHGVWPATEPWDWCSEWEA